MFRSPLVMPTMSHGSNRPLSAVASTTSVCHPPGFHNSLYVYKPNDFQSPHSISKYVWVMNYTLPKSKIFKLNINTQ